MVYYIASAAFNAAKSLLGYSSASAAAPTAKVASPEPIHRPLSDEELSRLLAQVESRRGAEASRIDRDQESVRSVPDPVGNGTTRKDGHAVLRGSPSALGWTVDEEEEQNAWVVLMGDAIDGSVYEENDRTQQSRVRGSTDDGDDVRSPIAPSNQDIIKFFGTEKERGVSYIWSIIPSLKGAHQWILRRQVDPDAVPAEPEVVRQEMQTDTVDLVEHSHQEIATQTTIKTYCDAGVQVDPPAHVPEGALPPLPESTELVNVLPDGFRSESPDPSTTAAESPNSSRIPRLASRKNSVASFQSTSTRAGSPIAAKGSTPFPGQKISRMSSIRSIALRRAGSIAQIPAVAPTQVPATVPEGDVSSEKKATSGRFFNAVKKIGRSDSVIRAWKP